MSKFEEWQDSREYMTLAALAENAGMEETELHESPDDGATHGWLYHDGMWIVDLGEGKAWSLVDREDYSGSLESIEKWVYKETRYLVGE